LTTKRAIIKESYLVTSWECW